MFNPETEVQENRLSDGSTVFDVVTYTDDGQQLIIAMADERAARKLERLFNASEIVGIELVRA